MNGVPRMYPSIKAHDIESNNKMIKISFQNCLCETLGCFICLKLVITVIYMSMKKLS